MRQLSSLILTAALTACSHDPGTAAGNDAGPFGNNIDAFGGAGGASDAPGGPDLSCFTQPIAPPPTTAVNPMVLAGQVVEYTTAGITPVDAADVALFRAGQPVVLARTHSASNGAFATGSFTTNGQAMHAYLKATKSGYRTAFFYPPSPFSANTTTLIVPTLSDTEFSTVKALLGTTQDDAHNGALLVAVLDCADQPLAGATISVRRGQSSVGHAHDLGTVVPTAPGVFLVLDVPDGIVRVSATYQNQQLPEHEVAVRAKDPDCPTAKGTLTSTIVRP